MTSLSTLQWKSLVSCISLTLFKEFHGKSFNAKHLFDNAVSNIICSLLFGDRYEYGDAEFKDLIEILDKIFEFLATSVMVSYLCFSFLFGGLDYRLKTSINGTTEIFKIKAYILHSKNKTCP